MAIPNPYLAGNFAPVTDETTIDGLPVDGVLPPGLDGQYLRLGPNPARRPDEPYVWDATDTIVHAVEVRDGRAVSYRNRWILTPHVAGVLGIGPPTLDVECCERLVLAGRRVMAVARSGAAYEVSEHLVTRPLPTFEAPPADRCLGDVPARGHAHHPLVVDPGRLMTGDRGLVLVRPDGGEEVLDPTPQGWMTATVDDASVRLVSTLSLDGDRPFAGTVAYVHDLHRRSRLAFDFGPGRHPGELTFVPDDATRGGTEDGGWLVGFVHDDRRVADDLVVLDARRPADGPVATVRLPRRVPYGWHGLWRPR